MHLLSYHANKSLIVFIAEKTLSTIAMTTGKTRVTQPEDKLRDK